MPAAASRASRGTCEGKWRPTSAKRLADPVLEHHLLGVDGGPRARPRRLVGAPALAAERRPRMREDVELEVVVLGVELVEAGEHLVERPRAVDAVERERRDARIVDRVDDPERAEPDPRRGQRRRVGVGGDLERAAVGEHQVERLDLRRDCCGSGRPVPWVPVAIEPASVWRSMSPRFSNATPEVVEPAVELAEHDPRLDLDQARARRSTASTRSSRSQRTITPSVSAMSVNEWPEPDARTRRLALRGSAHDLGQLPRGCAGRSIADRRAALIARPVAPSRRHRRKRIRHTEPIPEGWQSG